MGKFKKTKVLFSSFLMAGLITGGTFLNKEDFLFYSESKNKREDASYSTKVLFDTKDVNKIIINYTGWL